MLRNSYKATSAVSTVPNASIAVLAVGDVALELNEIDLEWSNIYDGDTYVATSLRITGLALIYTNEIHSPASPLGQNIARFIKTVTSNAYTSNDPLYHNSFPYSELKTAYETADPFTSSPSQVSKDVETKKHNIMGISHGDPKFAQRAAQAFNENIGSVSCIPPANVVVFYKPHFMANMMQPLPAHMHHPYVAFTSGGMVIPGWAMFRPIEVELVSLDSNLGNDISALRVVIRVYFNGSAISSGYGSYLEPAYHKWSIGSVWRVGTKPRIAVRGKVVRRVMIGGAPSVWEFLPRVMPGLHLIQLEVASDDDSRATTYLAVYELDYVIPYFATNNMTMYNFFMTASVHSIAYYEVTEEAETYTQGGIAVQTAYETMLSRANIEANRQYEQGRILSSLGRSLLQRAANISNIMANAAGRAVDRATEGEVGSAVSSMAQAGTAAAAEGGAAMFDIADARLQGNYNQISRFISQKQLDAKALDEISNSVIRTAHVTVYGYPGAPVDQVLMAAYCIIKQIFLGWITVGLNPKQQLGWMVRDVVGLGESTTLLQKLAAGEPVNALSIPQLFPGGLLNAFFGVFGIAMGALGINIGGAALTLLQNMLQLETLTNPRYGKLNFDPGNFDAAWTELNNILYSQIANRESYSLPRRFPGFLQTPGTTGQVSLSADDALSLMLAIMGIRHIKSHVMVDHTSSIAKITLVVVFRSVDYSGNIFLHSMQRIYSGLDVNNLHGWREWPKIVAGGSEIFSPSLLIPGIIPIASSRLYNYYRMKATEFWSQPLAGPQKVLADSSLSNIYTFAHVLYDAEFPGHPNREEFLNKHIFDMRKFTSIYAHGGSIGTGYTTPTIVPSYHRPQKKTFYASGLGAGVPMECLWWMLDTMKGLGIGSEWSGNVSNLLVKENVSGASSVMNNYQ